MGDESASEHQSRAGQAITIVASILLAFMIDALWDDWIDERDARQLLQSFAEELDYNIALVEHSARFFKAKNQSTLKILEIAASGAPSSVSLEEFDRLLGDLTWWQDSHFRTGSLDAIVESGMLREIVPLKLRVSLAGWGNELNFMSQIERQDYDTYQNQLLPFLHDNVNLQQISNAFVGRPGGNSEGWIQFKLPMQSARDHRGLLVDTRFLSLMTNTYWNEADAIQFSGVFLRKAKELRVTIRQEGGL